MVEREKGGRAVSEKDSSRAQDSRQQTDSFKKTSLIFWHPFWKVVDSRVKISADYSRNKNPEFQTVQLLSQTSDILHIHTVARGIISITGEINLCSTSTTKFSRISPAGAFTNVQLSKKDSAR